MKKVIVKLERYHNALSDFETDFLYKGIMEPVPNNQNLVALNNLFVKTRLFIDRNGQSHPLSFMLNEEEMKYLETQLLYDLSTLELFTFKNLNSIFDIAHLKDSKDYIISYVEEMETEQNVGSGNILLPTQL